MSMRILIVGAGGVGTAAAAIAARRDFFEACVVADYDESRATTIVDRLADDRFTAAPIDASSADDGDVDLGVAVESRPGDEVVPARVVPERQPPVLRRVHYASRFVITCLMRV